MKRFKLLILIAGVALLLSAGVATGQGAYAAQVQSAIRALLGSNATVTGSWTFSSAVRAAYKSSDGTTGLTQTCSAAVVALTIKDGLVTAVTCP